MRITKQEWDNLKALEDKDVIIVIGLPGSGKTALLNSLSLPFIDDLHKDYEKDKKFYHYLEINTKCAVSSIDFCDSKNLSKFKQDLQFKYPSLKIGEVYFENNPHYCALNIIKRSLNRGDKFIALEDRIAMVGNIYNKKPLFELELSKLFTLYRKYIIPTDAYVLNVKSHEILNSN